MTPSQTSTLANDLTSDKAQLRKLLRARRARQTALEVETGSLRLSQQLVELLADAQTIGVFSPITGEVHVDVDRLRSPHSRTIAWPAVIDRRELRFFACDVLVPSGSFGIAEPQHENPVDPVDLDAVIVPALAFTRRGDRLGMGAGCYDRFLPLLRPDALRVGVAFDWQLLDVLPTEDHDARVHYVVTESEVVACSPPAQRTSRC